MTRKDKILAVLKSFEQNIAYDEGGITLACITRPLYERLAEVIIDYAYTLEVPTDEEIYLFYENAIEDNINGAVWMREEIIKRNK